MTNAIGRRATLALLGAAAVGACTRARPAPLNAAPLTAALPPDREEMVAVPGGRIYVRVNGNLNGPRPPLLMTHGGPGGHHGVFLPALALAEDRAIILYDQLDSGRSEKPADRANWNVPRFVDEIDPIRAALGLDRLHLLGHSWGGTIALEYGARRPAGLQSLILQGPLISTAAWLDDAARLRASLPPEVQARLTRCERQASAPGPECGEAVDAFYARFWRLRPPPAYITAYEQAHGLSSNRDIYQTMWGPSEFQAPGTLGRYDGEPLLRRLSAPTLFLIGASDEILESTARRFAAQVEGAELAIIPDAAHRIQTDQPQAYIAALRDWLRRHDP